MLSNLKVRDFTNANIFGRHAKTALGFNYPMATDHRDELYILRAPGDDDKIIMLGGNGHIRMDVKKNLKDALGSEDPAFSTVYHHFSSLPDVPTVKDQVLKYCCR